MSLKQEFRQIIVKEAQGYPVRVGDSATVELAPAEDRSTSRFKGHKRGGAGRAEQAICDPSTPPEVARASRPTIQADPPTGTTEA